SDRQTRYVYPPAPRTPRRGAGKANKSTYKRRSHIAALVSLTRGNGMRGSHATRRINGADVHRHPREIVVVKIQQRIDPVCLQVCCDRSVCCGAVGVVEMNYVLLHS